MQSKGVRTPTQLRGERSGEMSLRKKKLSITGRNKISRINHFSVHGFDCTQILQSLVFNFRMLSVLARKEIYYIISEELRSFLFIAAKKEFNQSILLFLA